jgi:hypothetical protein
MTQIERQEEKELAYRESTTRTRTSPVSRFQRRETAILSLLASRPPPRC